MSQGLHPSSSARGLHLRFHRDATSVLTLGTNVTHTRSNSSTISYESCYGLGSDLGSFLYWFGERILDGWVEVVIRLRLYAIRHIHKHRGDALALDIIKARYIRHACRDLIELSSHYYSLKIRRRAIGLLLTLLRPLDSWTMILLGSNFTEILSAHRLEASGDSVIADGVDEISRIVSLLSDHPCRCEECLHYLREVARIQGSPHGRPVEDTSHSRPSLTMICKRVLAKVRLIKHQQ